MHALFAKDLACMPIMLTMARDLSMAVTTLVYYVKACHSFSGSFSDSVPEEDMHMDVDLGSEMNLGDIMMLMITTPRDELSSSRL